MSSYRDSHSAPGYARLYDRTFAEGYYARLWNDVERPLVQSILAGLAAGGARRSLDFACGTGRILALHEAIFDDVVGNDVSAEMAARARERCPRARIVVGDVTAQGAGRVPRDRQVCTAFRFFLNAEPELRHAAMAALRDCLVRDGHLVANFHVNSISPMGRLYRVRNALARRTINNVMSEGEAVALFRSHGFAVEAVHRYGLWPRIGWHFDTLNRKLLSRAETMGRRLPFLQRYAQTFILVGRRQ
ncbi:class I SAM-dependent DNA methyltransferase [Phreatobacter sp. AB_2022a]|uniref:class I SAM-dependent DNA methyltransferase n=1 Tax=Phreatobacter sp. AB_2022a TaxID=3003134 RepID=UPI002287559C|nr:class I SAM-dependent methyltransferase [Phreatobacter sp. AB_2022a]MCZ0737148.1 class I SAM-dependent methyltransferase [Phreatobacter sp. AB_2022a]